MINLFFHFVVNSKYKLFKIKAKNIPFFITIRLFPVHLQDTAIIIILSKTESKKPLTQIQLHYKFDFKKGIKNTY